jgi:hypothetical protein
VLFKPLPYFACFARSESRGFFHHENEVGNLLRSGWITDVFSGLSSYRAIGVYQLFAGGIQNHEEGQADAFAIPFLQVIHSTRSLDSLVLFHYVELENNEIRKQQFRYFPVFDKLVESAAPFSPGSIKEDQDLLILPGGLGFCFCEQSISARFLCKRFLGLLRKKHAGKYEKRQEHDLLK